MLALTESIERSLQSQKRISTSNLSLLCPIHVVYCAIWKEIMIINLSLANAIIIFNKDIMYCSAMSHSVCSSVFNPRPRPRLVREEAWLCFWLLILCFWELIHCSMFLQRYGQLGIVSAVSSS